MPRELHVHAVPTRAEYLRTVVEIVAIVAAGLWALYVFVYEQKVKPLSEPPAFTLPTDVERGPTVNGVVFLTIHRRVQNNGNVPIDIAAEALSVYGESLARKAGRHVSFDSPTRKNISFDVQRKPTSLIYTFAKLREGALEGDQHSGFFLPPHSSGEEDVLIAVPAHAYPVILISRRDYVGRAPIKPKIPVKIVRSPMGGYDLQSDVNDGEYDSVQEYPIKP